MVTASQKSINEIYIYTHTMKKQSNTTLKIVIKSLKNKREGRKKTYEDISKTISKMSIRTYIFIITLNVNGLNATTNRLRLTGYKNKTYIYAV